MPWLIDLYVFVFMGVAAWAAIDDFRDGRPAWYLLCDGLSSVLLAWCIIAYWTPIVSLDSFAGVILVALGLSVLWDGRAAYRSISRSQLSSEFTPAEERQAAVAGLILALSVLVPAYIFGFQVVQRGFATSAAQDLEPSRDV